MDVKIEESWKNALGDEFQKDYFKNLANFIKNEYANTNVYPPPKEIFRSFDLCPVDSTKVVILGQDPYHGHGQANGLSFSVSKEVSLPPSLQNIFKEIKDDTGRLELTDGDLRPWANQGVLLLNATLTVKGGQAGSHQGKGWEEFTDRTIEYLSENKQHIVFMLWGNYAKEKGSKVDRKKHLVLETTHPSPFSADKGFLGARHFTKANTYLVLHDKTPINW